MARPEISRDSAESERDEGATEVTPRRADTDKSNGAANVTRRRDTDIAASATGMWVTRYRIPTRAPQGLLTDRTPQRVGNTGSLWRQQSQPPSGA